MGIVVWHGGHKWEGPPAIQICRKGKFEHGPGIYCTTKLSTAARYAKGGGRIVKMDLFPDIGWLEDAKLPIDAVMDFVRGSTRLRKKRVLETDLLGCLDRREGLMAGGMMPANFLVNIAIDDECLNGEGGRELAEFLSANGIHASLYRKSGEDWVVLFEPRAIENYQVMSSKDIDWEGDGVPGVREQLAFLAAAVPAPSSFIHGPR